MLNDNNIQWEVIPAFPDYELNKFGQIRVRKTKHIRATSTQNCGYESITLSKNKTKFTRTVHRLIMETLNPVEGMNKLQVNHINGNKLDNNLSNLEWVTCGQNLKHAFATGLKDSSKQKFYIGKKHALSVTKYHNVSYDKSRNKFIGKITHNNKAYEPKRFDTEIEAAEHVNYLIDKYNFDRPKNVIS